MKKEMQNNEIYQNILNIILSLVNDKEEKYSIKKITSTDYGKGIVINGEKDWTHLDGTAWILSNKSKLEKIENKNLEVPLGIKSKLINTFNEGHSVIIGNDFYYPEGILLPEKYDIIIPTKMNNINCYLKEDYLKYITIEVRKFIIQNGFEVLNRPNEVIAEVKEKNKVKKLKK